MWNFQDVLCTDLVTDFLFKKIVLFMFNKVVETSGVIFSKWDAIALFYIDLKPFYVLLEGCNIFCT